MVAVFFQLLGNLKQQNGTDGHEGHSVVQHMLSMYKAQGSIPSTIKKKSDLCLSGHEKWGLGEASTSENSEN